MLLQICEGCKGFGAALTNMLLLSMFRPKLRRKIKYINTKYFIYRYIQRYIQHICTIFVCTFNLSVQYLYVPSPYLSNICKYL